jgi:hypothetical protein
MAAGTALVFLWLYAGGLVGIGHTLPDPIGFQSALRDLIPRCEKHGSLLTRRWREKDSNHRSRGRRPAAAWCVGEMGCL